MHGAAVPSNSAVMSPLLVAKTTVCLAFGVGDGSGGRPTSKRFGFFVSVAADSAYLHGPLVFFGARAAIFFGVRDGSGVWVLLGLGDGELVELLFWAAGFFLSSPVTTTTNVTTRAASTTVPAPVAISVRRLRTASCCWRRSSCRSRWR